MGFEFKIGWCPFCNQGWSEIVKDTSTNDLLVLCSECDTIWNSPSDFINNKPSAGYQNFAKITDTNFKEIGSKKWEEFII